MKRNSFFLALVLTVFAFGLANGASEVTLESISGAQYFGDSIGYNVAGNVVYQLRVTVDAGIDTKITGYSNGFISYVQGGTIDRTAITHGYLTWPAGDATGFDGGIFTGQFGNDGVDNDTVTYAGFTIFGAGMPAGWNEVSYELAVGFSNSGFSGDPEFCIDSVRLWPPTVTWKWVDAANSDIFPAWDGPHCLQVEFISNQKPIITNDPVTITESHCTMMSYDFLATDPEGDPIIGWNASVGTITAGGHWEFMPNMGMVGVANSVDIEACDAFGCGPITVNLVATNDAPTVTNCPGALGAQTGVATVFDLDGDDSCPGDPMLWSIFDDGGAIGALAIDANGVLSFTADATDANPTTVVVEVSDGNMSTQCTIAFNVFSGAPFGVVIEKDEGQTGVGALQGHFTTVDVTMDAAVGVVGGFNFLMVYDASVLSFTTASASAALVACDWEYFTYRVGADGNCSGGCPSGVVRVVGIAETNNGPHHPDPACDLSGQILFSMEFLVSSDYTVNCQFAPIRFWWVECGDNTMTNAAGDTLFLTQTIRDYTGLGDPLLGDYGVDLSGDSCTLQPFPTYRGHPCECYVGGGIDKPAPIGAIDFKNGGVDIVCVDELDDRGDINLDGLAYTIADAVMFTNYFIYGLSSFPDIAGTYSLEGAIAATDVNADGLTLTVADLVYLIRVVVGDAAPYPKTSPVAIQVSYTENGHISVPTDMGAAYLVVAGDVTPLLLADNMEMGFNYDGENTHIMVYSHEANETFSGEFLAAGGNVTYLEMATYDGAPVAHTLVPSEFTVAQNYPNPFNPRTTIQFAMPEAGDYSVKIYNITGQLVEEMTGNGVAGPHTVSWDAADNASGIYFYKVTAGNFSKTMKMVLLK